MDEKRTNTKKRSTARIALALLLVSGGAAYEPVRATRGATSAKRQATIENEFYCDLKALSPTERVHHKELTEMLIASRTDVVETEKGYEFEYSPSKVSLAQLADWVAAEGKCCPFFDFHIDLEREGSLLCLRLTGKEGIKPLIRQEFQVTDKK